VALEVAVQRTIDSIRRATTDASARESRRAKPVGVFSGERRVFLSLSRTTGICVVSDTFGRREMRLNSQGFYVLTTHASCMCKQTRVVVVVVVVAPRRATFLRQENKTPKGHRLLTP
jgi:hypothetical protein